MRNIYDSRFSHVCSQHSKMTQKHPHKDAMKLFCLLDVGYRFRERRLFLKMLRKTQTT